MPRPKRAVQYDSLRVSLPPEVAAELRLRCYSPYHVYGAPQGALSNMVADALREYFTAHPLKETQHEPE